MGKRAWKSSVMARILMEEDRGKPNITKIFFTFYIFLSYAVEYCIGKKGRTVKVSPVCYFLGDERRRPAITTSYSVDNTAVSRIFTCSYTHTHKHTCTHARVWVVGQIWSITALAFRSLTAAAARRTVQRRAFGSPAIFRHTCRSISVVRRNNNNIYPAVSIVVALAPPLAHCYRE